MDNTGCQARQEIADIYLDIYKNRVNDKIEKIYTSIFFFILL